MNEAAALYYRARSAWDAGRRARALVASVERERQLSRPGHYILVSADGSERQVGTPPPSLRDWQIARWYPTALERAAYRLDLDEWVHVDHWVETWVFVCRGVYGASRRLALLTAAGVDSTIDPKERTRTRRAPKRNRAMMLQAIAEETSRVARVEESYVLLVDYNGGRGKVRLRSIGDAASAVRKLDSVNRSIVDEWSRWKATLGQRAPSLRPLWSKLIAMRTRWIRAAMRNHDSSNLLTSQRIS